MADFNEKLIFNLEVNAASFAAKLKDAVDSAVKNLTPKLTVRAADIEIVGKIKAEKIFDLSGLAAAIKAAIGPGAISSPTGPAAGGGAAGSPVVNTAQAKPGGNIVDTVEKTNKEIEAAERKTARIRKEIADDIARARAESENSIVNNSKNRAEALKAIEKEIASFAKAAKKSEVEDFKAAEKEKERASRERIGRISPGPKLPTGGVFPEGTSVGKITGDLLSKSFSDVALNVAKSGLKDIAEAEKVAKREAESASEAIKQETIELQKLSESFAPKNIIKSQNEIIKSILDEAAAIRKVADERAKFLAGKQDKAGIFSGPLEQGKTKVGGPALGNFEAAAVSLSNFNNALSLTIGQAAKASFAYTGIGQKITESFNGAAPSTQSLIRGIGNLSTQAFRLSSISFNAVTNSLAAVGNIARSVLAPITSLFSTILRSTAILTGSGLLVGGPALIPVASIRALGGAFEELNTFTKEVSQSVIVFSDRISALSGTDRVAFISNKFNELGAVIQDVSVKFGLTTKDVSSGLNEILTSGVGLSSTSERMNALSEAAKVALIGVTDTSTAFKGLTAISSAFGLSFQDSADKLFSIKNLSIAPLSEIAPELGKVANIAAQAGVSIDEFVGAIATITSKGVTVPAALIALRQFFAQIAEGGSGAEKKLLANLESTKGIKLDFNINTLRAEGGLKSFIEKIREIQKIDPEFISEFFNVRAQPGLLPLFNDINGLIKNISKSTNDKGNADIAANTILNTLFASYDRLRIGIRNVIITTADHIANIINLKSVIDSVLENITAFQVALRGVSFPDLKKFISDLLTTRQGLASIGNFLSENFSEAFEKVKVITASSLLLIAQLFLEGGKLAGRALTSGITSSIASSSKGILTDVSNFLAAGFAAGDVGLKSLGNNLGLVSDKTLKEAELVERIIDRARSAPSVSSGGKDEFLKGIVESFSSFSEHFLTTLSDSDQSIEERLQNLKFSINAEKLRKSADDFRSILEESISGINIFPASSIDPLVKSIQELQSIDIATKLIGTGKLDLDKLRSDLKSKLVDLKIEVPVIELSTDVDNSALFEARHQILDNIDLYKKAIELNNQSAFGKTLNPGIKAGLENERDRLEEVSDKISKLRKIGAFPAELFDSLKVKDAGNTVISQLRAVNNAFAENVNISQGTGFTDELEKRQNVLRDLAKVLASRVLQLNVKGLVDFSDVESQVKRGSNNLINNVSDNFNSISKKVFQTIIVPGPDLLGFQTIKLPKIEISKVDRDDVRDTILKYIEQLRAIASNPSLDTIKFTGAKASISSTIDSLQDVLKILAKIKESGGTVGDEFSKGFDEIEFSILDSSKNIDGFVQAIKGSLKEVGKEFKEAADTMSGAAKSLSESTSGAKLQADTGGFLQPDNSPRQIIDARQQTMNVIAGIGAAIGGATDSVVQYVQSVFGLPAK